MSSTIEVWVDLKADSHQRLALVSEQFLQRSGLHGEPIPGLPIEKHGINANIPVITIKYFFMGLP